MKLADAVEHGPIPPADDLWAQAVDDMRRGMIVTGSVISRGNAIDVYLTRTFQRAWSDIRFRGAERMTINLICAQIAANMVDPMPWAAPVRLPREPLGSRMASPLPGVTITWLPNPANPQVPVLMTLERV